MAQTISRENAEDMWASTEYPVILSIPSMGVYKILDGDPSVPDFDEPLPMRMLG